MNISEVKELIELINSSDLAYFELQTAETNLKMDKSMTRGINSIKVNEEKNIDEIKKVSTVEVKSQVENKVEKQDKPEEIVSGKIITSPMVGTFYAAASPDAKPFASVGEEVKKGDVLCIIEAMKLMNEIESEESGKILEVFVKDGDMVEYGTPLFKIEEA